jgi:glucose uptake protein GlcU
MLWLIPLGLLVVFEAIADYFAGGYGEKGKFYFAFLAILFYVIGNISWLIAIRQGSGLTKGAIIFSVASAVLATIIGIVVYKETITTTQAIGVVIGLVSIVLVLK